MTVDELLSIPPADILSMSDDELAAKLAPLFPAARAPFLGQKSRDVIALQDGRKVSRKHQDAKLAQLNKLLQALNNPK